MNRKTKELNQLNNTLDKQINDENQEIFTNMICYLRGADISDYDQEVVRQDLSEMIISAQNRGERIHFVIGEDYKLFCDQIIGSLPPKTVKQKVIDFFDIACCCLSFLGFIMILTANETIPIIRNLITGRLLNFNISISVGSVISGCIIVIAAVIIVNVILKNAFKKINRAKTKGFLIAGGLIAAFLLIGRLGKETLFTLNIFMACGSVLLLFGIHKILGRI